MAAKRALLGPGGFRQSRIEARDTGGARQDGPAVRPAPGAGETVYAAFLGWRDFRDGVAVADVVVVRDDHGGRGPRPFSDLVDPGDGLPGRRVVDLHIPKTLVFSPLVPGLPDVETLLAALARVAEEGQ
ncbi:MAG TPA: hypothetical protein VHQ90_24950 [Thermoanaerobaculia bacterium]|nr:hypothetical protein [Thermoanaerobaculia bacterium]